MGEDIGGYKLNAYSSGRCDKAMENAGGTEGFCEQHREHRNRKRELGI